MQDALNAAIKHTEQSIFTRFAKADFAMFDAVEDTTVSFFGKCQRKATKPRHWQLFIYLYVPSGEAVEVVPIVFNSVGKCMPTELTEVINQNINNWLSENKCGYLKCTVVCRIK
jgi:hypothetical protein